MNLISPHRPPSSLFVESSAIPPSSLFVEPSPIPPSSLVVESSPIPGPHLLLRSSNREHILLRRAEPFTSIQNLRFASPQSRGFALNRAVRAPRCLRYLLRHRNFALRPVLVGLGTGDEPASRLTVVAGVGDNRGCTHDDGVRRKSVRGASEEECEGRLSWWRSPA